MFQSAPPAREATSEMRAAPGLPRVSIRASRAGGDVKRAGITIELLKFQSAPPAREATRAERVQMPDWVFQSAPPAREATPVPPPASVHAVVSIRASRAGGDAEGGEGTDARLGVSIRASRAGGDGERFRSPDPRAVSIRASRAGGDGAYFTVYTTGAQFQSAPPAREATAEPQS